MDVLHKLRWSVYAEACCEDDVIMCTDNAEENAIERRLRCEHWITEVNDENVPLCLVYSISTPADRELPLEGLRLLLTIDAFLDDCKMVHWTSFLGPPSYTESQYDSSVNGPIMVMDHDGLHYATAVFTTTFPRKWKGIELKISPVAVQRVLDQK